MVTSLKNLKDEIDSRLSAGGLSEIACCGLEGAQTILSNGLVYSVPDINSLPPAVANVGRFVYVEDINEYRFSNGTWTDDITSVPEVYATQLFSWSTGSCGRLGTGSTSNSCSPVREISSSTDWCRIAENNWHPGNAAIKTSGELWTWGKNCIGELGDGSVTDKCSPIREISSSTDWCQVSAGCQFKLAVKTTGELWAWGAATGGALGDGSAISKCSPVREISSSTDWCGAGGGREHSGAIKTSGQIWSWGRNNCGQLGAGTTVDVNSPVREISSATDWCQLSVGWRHIAAIKTSGQLWTWGNACCGVLGDGSITAKCSPVREISSSTDWCQVSAGYASTASIKTSGQLWVWGRNGSAYGQLGDGSYTDRCSPVREFCSATDWCQVSFGRRHSSAIKTTGELWVWGCSTFGIGDGRTSRSISPVREICNGTEWCQVISSMDMTSAIKTVSKGFNE